MSRRQEKRILRHVHRALIALLTLLTNLHVSGQDNYVRFKQITINDGLSLSSVYTIYQDSK